MNGIHDMGSMHEREADEPVFHCAWETGLWDVDCRTSSGAAGQALH